MKKAALLAFLLTAAFTPLVAAPADHLAAVPSTTAEEKEIISLLQFGPLAMQGGGDRAYIPVYNPTKYVINSCVARFTAPGAKIDKVYFSDPNGVKPFTDGLFQFATKFPGVNPDTVKYEILKITYDKVGEKKK